MIKTLAVLAAYMFSVITVLGLLIPSAYKLGILESESPRKTDWIVMFMLSSISLVIYLVLMPLMIPTSLVIEYLATAILVTFGATAIVGLLFLEMQYKIMFAIYSMLWTLPAFILFEIAKHF